MSCDSRNPTIQEYCNFRLRNIPYGSDVKPQSCYDRPVDDAGNARLVLEWGDWLVIGVYFVIVLGAGLGISLIGKKKASSSAATDFLLAGRSMWFLPVAFSLYSSNIGSSSFIGLAGSGAAAGIAVGVFEWNAMICLLMLGWLFVPVYLASGIKTMPEFLQRRFPGERIQLYLAVLSLFIYIFTKISADLFSGSLFISLAIPSLNLYVAIIILLAITAAYSVAGGLKAVIYVEALQTVIMVIGSVIMAVYAFNEIGSENESAWDSLWAKYNCSIPSDYLSPLETQNGDACGAVRDDFDHVLRAPDADLPWPVACVDPDNCKSYCNSNIGCSNIAYPTLILRLLPAGLRGMLMAVMLAALMSSLTSTFNSGATLFTLDIYAKIRKNASQAELLIISRLTMLALCGISILWLPIVQNSSDGQLFDYIQAITSYLGPPVVTIFVLGIFWPRCNEPGAFWGLLCGLIIGLTKMLLEFTQPTGLCGDTLPKPLVLSKMHYLHFAILLAFLTVIIAIVVSLLTPPLDPRYLPRMTYWTRFSNKKRKSISDLKPKEEISQAEVPKWLKCLVRENKTSSEEISIAEEQPNEEHDVEEDPCKILKEEKSWNIAANVAAVFLAVSCVFLHAYFA
ncbi:Oidioi.mRNA.OKI2018_I69.PAR.g12420.t1.cds [Oikopleura dioica]|uniref:Oidioi.mRNA.OKI2018_I69.PAR.g12420.t1.cds n=1 Tax=Oikopleura dioica TaxID=34765 RepID=A0ABN7S7Q8_OIKDI|nr:Oidioi.mRNA.OKI2018_I69.PAR.g12420.t1.cds [Oikopleura dioica]